MLIICSIIAVAAGAAILAKRPEEGVIRRLESTYGFRTKEVHQKSADAHRDAKPILDLDGNLYVDTIQNFVWKVSQSPHGQSRETAEHYKDQIYARNREWEPAIRTHTFPVDEKSLVCEEELYVSDINTMTGYPMDHEENRGMNTYVLVTIAIDLFCIRCRAGGDNFDRLHIVAEEAANKGYRQNWEGQG